MKVEAHIVVLLKRVHQLEAMVSDLIHVVNSNTVNVWTKTCDTVCPEDVRDALSHLLDAGVPFDPSCSSCKAELRIVNEGTAWESFECPQCEAWWFPNVK